MNMPEDLYRLYAEYGIASEKAQYNGLGNLDSVLMSTSSHEIIRKNAYEKNNLAETESGNCS